LVVVELEETQTHKLFQTTVEHPRSARSLPSVEVALVVKLQLATQPMSVVLVVEQVCQDKGVEETPLEPQTKATQVAVVHQTPLAVAEVLVLLA
jgi:hypothetical protein